MMNEVVLFVEFPLDFDSGALAAMIFCTVDVMASPSVKLEEFGTMRAIFWNANVMANIANCIATWKREVRHMSTFSWFAVGSAHGVLALNVGDR